MRPSRLLLLGIFISAIGLLAVCMPSSPAMVSNDDQPNLIIFFAGDLEGYLEECG